MIVLKALGMCLAVLISLHLSASGADPGARVLVGVLEHHHLQWPDWGPSSFPELERRYKFQVRVLFEKRDAAWVAFPHHVATLEALHASPTGYPRVITWFVAFAGKTLGQFRSTAPPTVVHYADIGLHRPDPGAQLPRVGRFTREFAGWLDEPSFRPLMLVSHRHTADPQQWAPTPPPPALVAAGVQAFKKSVGPVAFCDQEYGSAPTTAYADGLIRPGKSYASKDGQYLVSLRLESSRQGCDGPSDAWAVRWFHGRADGGLRFLGTGLTFLDAGDYDADGVSEVVFWHDGYNKSGYVLFYNRFVSHVDFTWTYH